MHKKTANNIRRDLFFPRKELILMWDKIALILVTIGALNWGAIGLFKFDIVAWIFGGQAATVSRIIYVLVALAGIWCISFLFREGVLAEHSEQHSEN